VTEVPTRPPDVLIRATSGWRSLDLREIWRFREILRALARRDLTLRYRQTALGVSWVVLQPILGAAIFTLVFGRVAHLPSGGIPYFLLSFAGLVGWTAFSQTASRASTSLVQNSALLTKVYFPRVILPVSVAGSSLVDFAVSIVLLGAIASGYGYQPSLRLFAVPLFLLLLLTVAVGLGLILATATASFRDVQYIVPVLLQFLLYLAPVGYSASVVPSRYRTIYDLNPLTLPLEGLRWAFLGHGSMPTLAWVSSASGAVLLMVIGFAVFRRFEQRLADVI
jgi:lipopolysaccharide transport system permease protein